MAWGWGWGPRLGVTPSQGWSLSGWSPGSFQSLRSSLELLHHGRCRTHHRHANQGVDVDCFRAMVLKQVRQALAGKMVGQPRHIRGPIWSMQYQRNGLACMLVLNAPWRRHAGRPEFDAFLKGQPLTKQLLCVVCQ
jgi:hypothetical protein